MDSLRRPLRTLGMVFLVSTLCGLPGLANTRFARATGKTCAFCHVLAGSRELNHAGMYFMEHSSFAGYLEPAQMLILVNQDVPASSAVAEMYQELRGVPKENLLGLSLGTSRAITREQYRSLVAAPVKKYLGEHKEIRCILTTSGVPYSVAATPGKEDDASLDNELAAVLREEPADWNGTQPNPLYLKMSNQFAITDPRRLDMVFVVRLDGPDQPTITRMVQDAMAAEQNGLQGPVFGDARGLDGITGYAADDASIRGAVDRLSAAGFKATLDLQEASWTQPKGETGDQAAGAAFYFGWRKGREFQDIYGKEGLARGAIAWHTAGTEADSIGGQIEKGWGENLLRRGAAVTLEPVRDPHEHAFPQGDVFVESLLAGATIAESYWLALPHVSWAMVILGDPLYRPFSVHPKPSLMIRAYVAQDANHVLEKDETAALLVLVQCLGPSGSGTPALSVTAEPGTGLKEASGSATIPPLQARETALISVAKVSAGSDPTGLFRLHLNVRAGEEVIRRIVVEGRTGFSRITGELTPESQMFLSPGGELLISGQPGKSVLIETSTLRYSPLSLPRELARVGVEFSPDGKNLAAAFLDRKQNRTAVLLTDEKFSNVRTLPAETLFLRWLGNEEVLVSGRDSLIRHDISGKGNRVLPVPEGWLPVNMIAGTETLVLATKEGRLGIKMGSEQEQEVLKGVQASRFQAVAEDLSLFGGVDERERLWIQYGLQDDPVQIAAGVNQILWGPLSRRAVIQTNDQRTRVYNGHDGSWTDLGVVLTAEWSPAEQRLLFLEGKQLPQGTAPVFLSLLSGNKVMRLCPFDRIGQIRRIVFTADGRRAFLLANLADGLDVWMVALPI